MYPKPHTIYESRTVFAYFLTISCILHLIFIFSTSSLSRILKPELNLKDYTSGKDKYVIEIELESGMEKEKSIEAEKELMKEKEEEEIEENLPEEKRQLFVDTSDKVVDEEPQADTDRVGEKGSIARDMYNEEDNVNDEPRLESDFELPGEVPDVLASVEPQDAGFPMEALYGEATESATGAVPKPLIEEEIIDSLSDENNNEMMSASNEVETFNELQDVPVVQDAKLDDVKDTSSQALNRPHSPASLLPQGSSGASSSGGTGQAEDNDDILSSTLDSEVVILEDKSFENKETETEVVEESTDEITESVEEYTKMASIPMTKMKEIVEGSRDSISNESQGVNVPAGDDVPFFEDNISNAPLPGKESFNIKKHEYAPYYKHIRDKVRLYWLLQYGTDASINQVTEDYKPIIVTFKVLPAGRIVDVIIIDSAGNELLASKIRISIQNTILNKFPEYIDEKYINVRFSYYFF
ncbi:MAG: hypothetical protein SCARUB_01518 [Candidatus Scalindua rubra]|uniref:TonB C-terminal domain-containing protein n=1 Tax=Candidatus Scalindua rubra TaxID=1872076 RepID=A0A1E3XCM5_9BACT|nr:MAG: hypothetical protein SCARUB_01518 [Candidatus Scalindua rubra]